MAHQQIGRDVLLRFEEYCKELGTVDKRPTLEGRQMTMMINPIVKKSEKKQKPEAKPAEKAEEASAE